MLVLCGICFVASAQAVERFEVSHAQTSLIDGEYFLNADIAYSLHPEALKILQQGLAVRIELQVEIFRPRRYWRNKRLASVNKLFLLQFNAVTERFVVSMPEESLQQSYATGEDAVYSLRNLEDLALFESSVISDPEKTQARARLVVDVRHFPDPLQYLAKYWDDWVKTSEWYVWPIKL